MPPPFPRSHLLNTYRLFHLSARLRLRHFPARRADDYYALLLSAPLPAPAKRIRIGGYGDGAEDGRVEGDREGGKNGGDVDMVGLSGKKERDKGTERGIQRPEEPDNCCMSGCVHCVWDAYREEVEGWVAGRRGEVDGGGGMHVRDGDGGVEGSVESVLEGVPVGIRAFMDMEKRLGERRGKKGEG